MKSLEIPSSPHASDVAKKIPSVFIEELGKLIGSFLAERERKRQTTEEGMDAFSVDKANPSIQSSPEE